MLTTPEYLNERQGYGQTAFSAMYCELDGNEREDLGRLIEIENTEHHDPFKSSRTP